MGRDIFGSSDVQAQIDAQKEAFKLPEEQLAGMFERDLGVKINPQALRMFIRCRWGALSALAHKIHHAATGV